jgi:hypothetical protein
MKRKLKNGKFLRKKSCFLFHRQKRVSEIRLSEASLAVRFRVARFFFILNTKTVGGTGQIATKLPNGHKLYQMDVIYSK